MTNFQPICVNMNRYIPRLIAVILVLTALGGIALSAAGIFVVQKARPLALAWGNQGLAAARETLQTLNDTITLTQDGLAVVSANLTEVNRALSTSADALADAQPTLDEFKTLLDESIPETVDDTQTALYAAQKDAALIEQSLALLTAIPFMPGEAYQPDQPLSESLGQIAYTLGDIPESTQKISADLDVTKANLALLQVSLMSISLQLDDAQTTLGDAAQLLPRYRDLISRLDARLSDLEKRLPAWISFAATALTVIFVWAGLTQIGLLLQGLDWWQRGNGSN